MVRKIDVEHAMTLPGMQDAVLIGSVEDRENYYPAIDNYDVDKGIFIYDYNKLVECFAISFENSDDCDSDLLTEAAEWVHYNVIGSLPYYGEHAPKIKLNEYQGNLESC